MFSGMFSLVGQSVASYLESPADTYRRGKKKGPVMEPKGRPSWPRGNASAADITLRCQADSLGTLENIGEIFSENLNVTVAIEFDFRIAVGFG